MTEARSSACVFIGMGRMNGEPIRIAEMDIFISFLRK